MKKLLKVVDANDAVSLAGLVLVGIGVGMVSVPAMLVVVGSLLLGIGVLGAMRRGKG